MRGGEEGRSSPGWERELGRSEDSDGVQGHSSGAEGKGYAGHLLRVTLREASGWAPWEQMLELLGEGAVRERDEETLVR